ncbi:hypothetical protein KL86DES1_21533 [uncultured Desulfovibrio sp.]|uniref:Uncharacterized protein n=1 Tax=uncultured Desulfovibrio sp. TaxID=167968 RepID=A0A212L8K5_9BACT|nr:hypothetical protein KL86DES1_21533 [uncultured Desulfovibrio sp.]VZH34433.1 conserved protein of unknown function [Desulfovibrio sp. 86]
MFKCFYVGLSIIGMLKQDKEEVQTGSNTAYPSSLTPKMIEDVQ